MFGSCGNDNLLWLLLLWQLLGGGCANSNGCSNNAFWLLLLLSLLDGDTQTINGKRSSAPVTARFFSDAQIC